MMMIRHYVVIFLLGADIRARNLKDHDVVFMAVLYGHSSKGRDPIDDFDGYGDNDDDERNHDDDGYDNDGDGNGNSYDVLNML